MIDWESLARRLGTILPKEPGNQYMEHGSSALGCRALEQIIDDSDWAAAVDHYVAGRPGSELARSVLWLVHPLAGMERCREIVQTATDVEERRTAVELLRVVADRRALPWIETFLHDDDALVQVWAAKAVEQLYFAGLVEHEQCESLLAAMERHSNLKVREVFEDIRQAE